MLVVDVILAQSGMTRFQGNMSGTAGGGSGIPIDGGISSVIVGSLVYGYKKAKDKFKK
jgi:hypothetical protein